MFSVSSCYNWDWSWSVRSYGKCDSVRFRRLRGPQLGHPEMVRKAQWLEDEVRLPPPSILNQEYRNRWAPSYRGGNVVTWGHRGSTDPRGGASLPSHNTGVICCLAPGRPESAVPAPDNKSLGCCCHNSQPTDRDQSLKYPTLSPKKPAAP